MKQQIIINNQTFRLKDLSIADEPIWSTDTGRTSDGTMVGTIVAWKIKLNLVFPPMSDREASLLGSALHQAFFDVKFRNPRTGEDETKPMYAGSSTYPVYSYAESLPRYVGVGVNLIEQ